MITRHSSRIWLAALCVLLLAITETGRAQVITDFYRSGAGVPGTNWRFGEPGDTVTVQGGGFTGATHVSFLGEVGGRVYVPVFPPTDNSIPNVTVPSGVGTGPLAIRKFGIDFIGGPTFTPIGPAPHIVSLSANVGGLGTMISIEADNLVNNLSQSIVTGVAFNGVAAGFAVNTVNQITAQVPLSSTGPITVTSLLGPGSSGTNFFYYPAVVTNSFPNIAAPGGEVMIQGLNFLGASSVFFANGQSAAFNVVSNTLLTATVPPGARTGKLLVIGPAGGIQSTNQFLVPPTLGGFSPSNGPVGQVVNIRGTNLFNASSVTFNGIAGLDLVTNSAGSNVTATVANGTRTGFIIVTTPSGSVTSAVPFYLPPTFTDPPFSPEDGLAGTNVTLFGLNFSNATGVTFGSVPATFSNLSPTSIRAVVPGSALSGPVVVTTPGGQVSSSPESFRVRPVITGFTPTSGLPGVEVTITGTNFTATPVVTFNFTNATVTFTSLTTLKALVPTNATTGTIRVGTLGGVADSGTIFTVLVPDTDIDLAVALTNGSIAISWPTDLAGFRLQATPTLTPPIFWGPAGGSTSVVNGRVTVLNPATGSNGFFRLIRP